MRKTKEFEIGRFLTNSEGYLKNKYLLSLMFEVSFDQAEEVEDEKIMKDKRWLVYSWDIKIEKPIKAKDKIKITTFAIYMNKFYAYRNFFIEKDGEIIAKAYCVFLLFDLKKNAPGKKFQKKLQVPTKKKIQFMKKNLTNTIKILDL
ncbi:Acyl-ACP thioesterase [Anaerococcus hydrogenalis DSM 7454]|uniref:Acyl-ACP thioesterase n=1 Tax=Anaerococcus hydrogenalis DSM 7454 TaxID=561177 RepID=B6WB00_9FIRM|nr:acyl-ACP thioesterase domain-containing protein [Anaerococcus hydrogenalis]EEB35269.1 Acyl-ACP thioesterase [Anaerococcus hydrogenalis DSM 7454]